MVVFPRTAVEIHQADRYSVVATPNQAIFYNSRHAYRRDLIDPRGDACEYFGVAPELAQEVLKSLGAPINDSRNPFDFSHSPCPPDVYLGQRALFQIAEQDLISDPLFVEEKLCAYLCSLLKRAISLHLPFAIKKKHRVSVKLDQVEGVKDFVARKFKSKLSVKQIADYVEVSPFHLCRIFKQYTNQSIHEFLMQFRLRNSIERILEGQEPLTKIALDLNFSSHSHFTNTFRKHFGVSPNQARRSDLAALL